MPVCEMATRVVGSIAAGEITRTARSFGFTGEMLEVALHLKIVHTQIYDPGDLGGFRWEVNHILSPSHSMRPTE